MKALGHLLIALLMLVIAGCTGDRPQPIAPVQPTAPAPPVSSVQAGPGPAQTPGPAPSPVPSPAPATGPASEPAAPVKETPRLLLDLTLGDAPDQPGSMPGRVGGISPRGPLAMAAEWGSIYLMDQAKGQVLHYADGRPADRTPDYAGGPADRTPVPWLDEQADDLRISPWGLVLTVGQTEYTVARNGKLLGIRSLAAGSAPAADQKGLVQLLGKDGMGNLYELAVGSGRIARRVSKDGAVLAEASVTELGEIRDWYMGRDGSLYAMTWQWGQDRIDRIRVYEVLPTVTFSSPPGGVDPPIPPVLAGHPVPSRIHLSLPDWAPLEISSEVDCWNIWWLLATASPADDPLAGDPAWQVTMDADFPDGSTLTLHIQDGYLLLEGTRYRVGEFGALRSIIEALRLSEQGVQIALDAAESVRIAIDDLPGVEQELSWAQRQALRESLTGAMAVNPYTPPQPLERPSPQYAIRLKGRNWEGSLLLVGDLHLVKPQGRALLISGRTSALVREWLPVPNLAPDQVGYLYLADRLEIGQGNDLTQWKNTVVRQLIQARFDPGVRPFFREPFTLTFWVKGEQRTVEVDTEGFTYAGKRYPGSGLTNMMSLQGVP